MTEDADGRVIDLHAMRTTLGTNLARAGIAPQIAQRIMRHADYKTTLKHYTVLGLTDTAKAIEQLPTIEPIDRQGRFRDFHALRRTAATLLFSTMPRWTYVSHRGSWGTPASN